MSVVYGTTANVAGAAIRNFRIGPSLSNRIESNRDVRFEFESNLEASQVPSLSIQELSYRKQIARQLRTQFVEGIYRSDYS